MTAVSQEVPGTAYSAADESQSLRWTEQGFVFELRSSNEDLLKTARRVFIARTPPPAAITTRSWTVERVTGSQSETWLVSGTSENSSMLPVSAESLDVAILHVEYDMVDWLLNNSPDTITVHAALLSRGDRGVVIVGPSFAGKSTLAIALWRKGWSLMCDDLVFIDTESGTASPTPRRVSLRFGSRELVGDSAWNEIRATPSCIETEKGLFFHPHEVSGTDRNRTTTISGIFFLARLDAAVGAAERREINPAKAALSLLPYAFNARNLPFVEGLRRIKPLLDKIPAYDLGRGELTAMVDAVEAAVG